jgi:hypothetical protein
VLVADDVRSLVQAQRAEKDRAARLRAWLAIQLACMPEISVETTPDGRAYLRLGDGEVRDSVALGDHDQAHQIPSLDSLVLHFDYYGRLTAIEVTGAAASVLPPGLIDD